MRCTSLSLVLAGLVCTTVHAQTISWERTGTPFNAGVKVVSSPEGHIYVASMAGNLVKYDLTTGDELWEITLGALGGLVDMQWHPDGFLVAGGRSSNSFFDQSCDAVLQAISPAGDQLWEVIWNDSLDLGDELTDLDIDPTGHIVASVTSELTSTFNANHTLLRISPGGQLLWRRTVGMMFPWREFTRGVAAGPDGSVFLCGVIYLDDVDPDWTLLKWNASGVLQWTRTYSRSPGSPDQSSFVRAGASGECYVGGTTASEFNTDMSIRRYDGAGNATWIRHFGNGSEVSMNDMQLDGNGHLLAVGRTQLNNGDAGYVLQRLSLTNQVDWIVERTVPGGNGFYPEALDMDTDGSVVVAGRIYQGQDDLIVDLYDVQGDPQWNLIYPGVGSIGDERAFDVVFDGFGGIVCTGDDNDPIGDMRTFRICSQPAGVCLANVITQQAPTISGSTSADLDGDGYRDMATTSTFDPAVRIHYGTGGDFQSPTELPLPFLCRRLRAADMDQDGDTDLLLGRATGNEVVLVRNTGGGLAVEQAFDTGLPLTDLEVADLNGGAPDAVVAFQSVAFIGLLLNVGNGTFSQTDLASVPNVTDVDLADINGDGAVDIVVGHTGMDSIYVHWGTGTGAFGGPSGVYSGNSSNTVIGTGDVDRDGIPDLVSLTGQNGFRLMRGLGSGLFAPPSAHAMDLSGAHDLLVAPFPADTTVALVVPRSNVASVVVYSECTEEYQPFNLINASGTVHVAIADFTQDQGIDVVGYGSLGELARRLNCEDSPIVTDIPSGEMRDRKTGIAVFPNPSTGLVRVTWDDQEPVAALRVFTASGSVLMEEGLFKKGSMLDIASLDKGLHMVEIRTSGSVRIERLIVVR